MRTTLVVAAILSTVLLSLHTRGVEIASCEAPTPGGNPEAVVHVPSTQRILMASRDGGNYKLYHYDYELTLHGVTTLATGPTPTHVFDIELVVDPYTEELLAAWGVSSHPVFSTSFDEVVVAAYDRDGVAVTPETWIMPSAGVERDDGVGHFVPTPDGKILVSWTCGDTTVDGSSGAACHRWFDSGLTNPGPITATNTLSTTFNQYPTKAAPVGNNNVLIPWHTSHSPNIRVQMVDSSNSFPFPSGHDVSLSTILGIGASGIRNVQLASPDDPDYILAAVTLNSAGCMIASFQLVGTTLSNLHKSTISTARCSTIALIPGGAAITTQGDELFTFAYNGAGNGNPVQTSGPIDLGASVFPSIAFAPYIGTGRTALFVPTGAGIVRCLPAALVVNATICSDVGQEPYTLACLASLLANSSYTGRFSLFQLPSGVWTGCTPTGIVLTAATSISSESGNAADTIIDCQASGTAFVVDPEEVGLGSSFFASLVIADITIINAVSPSPLHGGAITFRNSPVPIRLSGLVFSNCSSPTGSGGALLGSSAVVHLENTTFTACSAASSGGGVALLYHDNAVAYTSVSYLSHLSFTECTAATGNGGGLALVASALLPSASFSLTDSVWDACTAPFGIGGGFHIELVQVTTASRLNVTSCVARSGGGVSLVDLGPVSVHALFATSCVATEPESSETYWGGGGVVAFSATRTDLMSLTLSHPVLVGNTAAGNGGGLSTVDVALVLTSGQVQGNSAGRHGGGVSFDSFALVDRSGALESSSVGRNTAEFGGGLALLGGTMDVVDAMVDANTAHLGGGVFTTSRALSLLGNSTLMENSASSGGGLFECLAAPECGARNTVCTSTSPTVWSSHAHATSLGGGNMALAGPLAASDPVALSSSLLGATGPDAIPTGTNPLLGAVLSATDVFGQPTLEPYALRAVVTPEASATRVELADAFCTSGVDGTCAMPGARVYGLDELDTLPSFDLRVELTQRPCVWTPGLSATTSFAPCPFEQVPRILGGRLVCLVLCPEGTFVNTSALSVGAPTACSPCPAGEYQFAVSHEEDTCLPCPSGTYSAAGAPVCRPCPVGADCGANRDRLWAEPGYWYPYSVTPESAVIPSALLACPGKDACVGGPDFAACSSEYKSDAWTCGKCAGDAAFINNTCVGCPPFEVTLAISAASLVLVLLILVYLIRSARSGAKVQAQVLKVTVNYLQILSLIATFKSQTSGLFASAVGGAAASANVSADFFTLVCLTHHTYFETFLFYAALPIVAFLLIRVYYACKVLARVSVPAGLRFLVLPWASSTSQPVRVANGLAVQATTVVMFLIYPSVARVTLSMFHCRDFGVGFKPRLVADLDVVCYEGKHLAYAFVALACVVVYVVALPVVTFFLFRRELSTRGFPAFLSSHMFLVSGYNPPAWAWELVILVRKTVVVCVVVFVESSDLQVTLGGMVAGLSLFLHASFQPFTTRLLNRLETTGLVALILTVAAAGSLDSGTNTSKFAQSIIVVGLLVVNGGTLLLFLFYGLQTRIVGLMSRFGGGRVSPSGGSGVYEEEGEEEEKGMAMNLTTTMMMSYSSDGESGGEHDGDV